MKPTANKIPGNPADGNSIDAIIAAIYDSISGPAGERDWDRLRTLVWPQARLIPTGRRANGQAGGAVLNAEEYIDDARAFLYRNSFYETEISRRSERFGNIAQLFSTYESRRAEHHSEPFLRGINSIQLYKHQDRWWVMTVFWQNEMPDCPIPNSYLPTGN